MTRKRLTIICYPDYEPLVRPIELTFTGDDDYPEELSEFICNCPTCKGEGYTYISASIEPEGFREVPCGDCRGLGMDRVAEFL